MILRTDLTITQLPSPMPNFGGTSGAGIIQTDPDFGTRIVRLTDTGTNHGLLIGTNDGAAPVIWNTDDTLIVVTSQYNQKIIYGFNPATMQGYFIDKLGDVGPCSFSRAGNNVMYLYSGTRILKYTFTEKNGVWQRPGPSTLVDFAPYLPSGFKTKWAGEIIPSVNDTRIAVAFSSGVQDTPGYVAVWDSTQGVRLLNSTSGEVTGDWGPTGIAVYENGVWPVGLHGADQTPNPEYIQMAGGGFGAHIWPTDGMEIIDPAYDTGHEVFGYMHLYGSSGGGQFKYAAYDNLAVTSNMIPDENLPYYHGQHPDFALHATFGLIDLGDNSPIIASTYDSSSPFSSAWANEVIRILPNGEVERVCHTFNSGNLANDMGHSAIANPSQTGKYIAFTSDMMGTVGTGRADVFVVETGQ